MHPPRPSSKLSPFRSPLPSPPSPKPTPWGNSRNSSISITSPHNSSNSSNNRSSHSSRNRSSSLPLLTPTRMVPLLLATTPTTPTPPPPTCTRASRCPATLPTLATPHPQFLPLLLLLLLQLLLLRPSPQPASLSTLSYLAPLLPFPVHLQLARLWLALCRWAVELAAGATTQKIVITALSTIKAGERGAGEMEDETGKEGMEKDEETAAVG